MSFYDTLCEIRDLADKASPTKVDLERTLKLFKTQAAEDYFFTRVRSIHWIQLLNAAGVFKQPPAVIRSGDTLRFPFWTKSAALARIAKTDASAVATVASKIPRTRNARVNDHLMEIAALVPTPEDVRRLLAQAIYYAKQPYHLSASDFGDVIEHWVSIGAIDAAFRLAQEILKFKRGYRPKLPRKGKRSRLQLGMFPEPEPRIPAWEFKQIVEGGIRKLSEAEPQRTLALLLGAIESYLRLSRKGPDDHSDIWCQDVASASSFHEGIGVVVSATVGCFSSSTSDHRRFRNADALVRSHDSLIFDRIRWYVYGRSPKIAQSAIVKDLFTYIPKFSTTLYPAEFADMIRRSVNALGKTLLPASRWRRLWYLLSREPVIKRSVNWLGHPLTEEELESRRSRLRQARLGPFKAVLPVRLARELRTLERRFGAVNYARFTMGETKTVESRSPLSQVALASKTNSELVDYLNTWQSSAPRSEEWWVETNMTGLTEQFLALMSEDPDRFRNWPNWWRELKRPIVLRRFMEKAAEAIKTKPTPDWPLWIDVAIWITQQPVQPEPKEATEESAEYPDWAPARNAVVRFLQAALSSEASIPFLYNHSVITLLTNLCSGFDPYADRNGTHQGDPLQRGINTIRGAAIEAAVRYAYWVRRNKSDELAPFWSIMEDRLSGTREVPAVYAVIATSVPMLTQLSEDWVRQNRELLFPKTPVSLWNATWDSFICYTNPHPKVFRAIREVYEYATTKLGVPSNGHSTHRDPRQALGMHLIILYWWGQIPLEDLALRRFYHSTPARIRGQVTREVARIFRQETKIEPQTLERLMMLCDQRLNAASMPHRVGGASDDTYFEIIEFASWFEITALPTNWRLDCLSRVLQLVDRIDSAHFNVEALAKEIPEYLGQVTRCFVLFSEKLPREAYIGTGGNAARSILKAGLASSNHEIHDTAVRARDNLLLAGRFEFMELDGF